MIYTMKTVRSNEEIRKIMDERKERGYEYLIDKSLSLVYEKFAEMCGLDSDKFKDMNWIEVIDRIGAEAYRIKSIEECKKYEKLLKKLKDFIFSFASNMDISYIIDGIELKLYWKLTQLCDYERSETRIKNKIVDNFDKYFPSYTFIKTEYQLPDKRRIDILAKDNISGRDVVIELKSTTGYNTNPQLLHYGSFFKNPILIGVNHSGKKLKNIIYMDINQVKYY